MATANAIYLCEENNEIDLDCAEICVGLYECQSCACVVQNEDSGGPLGSVGDVLLCVLPIFFLIVVTVKPNPWKTTLSLPVAAVIMYLVRLMYLGLDPLLTNACLVSGLHEAATPLSIMMGAITLFQTMEATHCMPYMIREIKKLTAGHVVAEAMLIFCFSCMVEGAGGFGTPLALVPPMFISMGHDPFRAVVMTLSWYNFPTPWGAAGAPLWFGFGNLNLSDEELIEVSYKVQTCMTVASFILIPFVLAVTMPFEVVRANILFVALTIAGCMGPALGISFVSYEFPALAGGLIGCIFCVFLIIFRIGLSDVTFLHHVTNNCTEDVTNSDHLGSSKNREELDNADGSNRDLEGNTKMIDDGKDIDDNNRESVDANSVHSDGVVNNNENSNDEDVVVEFTAFQLEPRRSWNDGYLRETLGRTFPIWGIVLILLVTRVNEFGFKRYLTMTEPYFEIKFGTYGDFRLSASLVFMLRNILSYPNLNWTFPALYIPFFFPFILISLFTMLLYRREMAVTPLDIARTVSGRMKNPTIALTGALILVQLIVQGGTSAPSYILGENFAIWFKEGFVAISAILGAFGTFFCGSGAVSNLTLGAVQRVAAEGIGISKTSIVALQALGAAAGNSISLGNIISSCAVIGLVVGEGKIFIRTARYAFSLTTIGTIVMLIFFIRF